jgi:hypothetical protein
MTSLRPVVPGMYPDPSVCRAGDTYYLVNSSFEYLPGLPIHASADMVNWELVGNALNRPNQLANGSDGPKMGIYAPTIRHRDGKFWIACTNILDVMHGLGHFILSAEDPAGPWSDPVWVPEAVGIDPDLCWDEGGTCHITWAAFSPAVRGIASAPIDLETGKLLGEPKLLWQGAGGAHPEGPHLYRREGWWYLMIAEGGTERGHSETIARARSLDGTWASTNDPVLTRRGSADPVQNVGHADLVELADGTWAAVHLGVRVRGGGHKFHVNGRETFLVGIDWVDGWPVADERRFATPLSDHSFADDFASWPLDQRWLGVGAFPEAFTRPAGNGGLVIEARPNGPEVPLLAIRVRDEEWSAEAQIDAAYGTARLELRIDSRHLCALAFDGESVEATLSIGPATQTLGRLAVAPGSIPMLRIRVRLPEPNPYWEPDEADFIILSAAAVDGAEHEFARFDGRYLSSEVAGGFTGRVVGIRALSGEPVVADFRYTTESAAK